MRYALNETPVNGWSTAFGVATADISFSTSANPALASIGTGSSVILMAATSYGNVQTPPSGTAALSFSSSGSGKAAARGDGSAAIVLSSSAIEHSVIRPSGTAALMFSASGMALISGKIYGTAKIIITATSSPVVSPWVSSRAEIEMYSFVNSGHLVAALGSGLSGMVFNSRYGIPYKPIPAGFVRNMNDREMIIPEDKRVFEVQADNALRVKNTGALRVRGERRL